MDGLLEEMAVRWRTGQSMDDLLSRFVVLTNSRASGVWRLVNGQLQFAGFGWAADMPDDVVRGFQAATRCVRLEQTNLGIVQAAVKNQPVIARRDPGTTGLDGSASWIVKFDANTSLAVPIRDSSSNIVGMLAVSTAAFIEPGDSLWQTIIELSNEIASGN